MKRNEKGFSLIELLAVLVVSTVVLVPLLASYTNSIRINDRSQNHELATSVAEGTFYAMGKMEYATIRSLLDDANTANQYYIELNGDSCSTLSPNPEVSPSETLCENVFNVIWSNQTFTAQELKVYIMDYYLTAQEITALTNNAQIVPRVRNAIANSEEINAVSTNGGPDVTNMVRVIVFVDYYDEPDQYFVMEGVIADD